MSWLLWRWRYHVVYWWAGARERRAARERACVHLAAGHCDECMADYFAWGHLPG